MISGYMAELRLGELQCFGNMGLLPLFTSVRGGPEYVTLKEALDAKLITITETGHSGSVPELRVINPSEQLVLLLDGEELIGAKQNRVLNTSILLSGNTEAIIPVSCTEQGRWRYSSREFSHSDTMLSSQIRLCNIGSVSSSLYNQQGYSSDQGRVWSDIEEMHGMAGTSSATRAMRDVYTAKNEELDEYVQAFEYLSHQRGSLFFINGRVAGVDVVSCEKAYKAVHPQLLKSYAMDALLLKTDQAGDASASKAEAFLQDVAKCEESRFDSIGRGFDYRFEASGITGSALVSDACVIHIAFISSDVPKPGEKPDLHLKSVLWVDDRPENIREEIALLTHGGTEVITATSTSEALENFESGKFDRIISDMGRKENGECNEQAGLELIREIRKRDKQIPIIIYCGESAFTECNNALAAGADAVTMSRNILFQALGHGPGDKPRRVTFPDGLEYAGPLKKGMPHGKGRLFLGYYEYAGQFENGLPHGHGATIFPGGTKIYEGHFKAGKPHGHGIRNSSDGTRYEGQFKHGMANGQGSIVYPNGHKYEGACHHTKPHGKGTWTFSDGFKYTGQFDYGRCSGRGIVTSPDGEKCEGEKTVTFPDGAEYAGRFEDGMFHGQGTIKYPDPHGMLSHHDVCFGLVDPEERLEFASGLSGSDGEERREYGYKYEGQFKEGVPHGRGTEAFSSGIKYEGSFKQGVAHGEGKLTFPGGAKGRLRFRHGELHGNVIKTYPDGHKYEGYQYEGPLEHSRPHGEGNWTFPDGSECTGRFENGRCQRWKAMISPDGKKYDGERRVMFPDGAEYAGQFKDGMFHGQGLIKYPGHRYSGRDTLIDSDGLDLFDLEEELELDFELDLEPDPQEDIDLDLLDLISEERSRKSVCKYEGQFSRGMPHGHGTETFSDGSECTGQFKNGMVHGNVVMTFASGEKYEGESEDYKPHGKGVRTLSDGTTYEGQFEKGRLLGKDRTSDFPDGRTYTGHLNADKMPHGKGTMKYPDGSEYTGWFKNGVRHGHGRMTYAGKAGYKGPFKDDMPYGRGTALSPEGRTYSGQFEEDRSRADDDNLSDMFEKDNVKRFITCAKAAGLKSLDIFSEIPEEVLVQVVPLFKMIDVRKGEDIFVKGEMGDSMYLLAEGKVRVYDGEKELASPEKKTAFEELAALVSEPRRATATATEDTKLFRLDQESLYDIMAKNVPLLLGVINGLCRRLRSGARVFVERLEVPDTDGGALILKSLDLFSEISEENLAGIASIGETAEVRKGDAIFVKGDICRSMHVVMEGRLCVRDGDMELAVLERGSVFRKLAVFSAEPCPYDITAVEETRLFRLDQKPLYEFMANHIEVAREVIRSLCQSLKPMA